MDRRDTIKSLLVGSLAGGALASTQGCKPGAVIEEEFVSPIKIGLGRTPEELERDKKLIREKFLTDSELGTLATLCDIILPATASAGSATDADVPAFIDFMARDATSLKTPIRGGIAWINNEARKRFNKTFDESSKDQQLKIIDDIAYPDKVADGMKQGANFFSRLRDLTLTGYYTTKIGFDDLGYVGNRPNVWDGVPDEVLKDHDVDYDPEWVAKCVDQSKRNDIAVWDEKGNLLT